jgi:hypothetical protein
LFFLPNRLLKNPFRADSGKGTTSVIAEKLKFDQAREGHDFTGRGKTRFCSCFRVAQRFTAAITATFSMPALAAEGRSIPSIDFFRSLFNRAVKPFKTARALALEVRFPLSK